MAVSREGDAAARGSRRLLEKATQMRRPEGSSGCWRRQRGGGGERDPAAAGDVVAEARGMMDSVAGC